MDISTSSTDEESPSSRLSKSNATIDLLFVNESSDLPPQPVGHRHDIRSHVRRHVARNFKQKHKGGAKTISTQRKLPLLLASRDQGQLASKFVLHHHDLPSALQPGSNSPSTLTARPERHDRNEPASPELEVLGDLGYYCNICGAQLQSPVDLTGLVHANDRRVNMTRHAWRPPLKPRLVEILGAGRVDPFLSYPVEKPDRYVHEVIDLSLTYIIPGLIPDDQPHYGTVNSVAKAWISAALTTPLLFHALVFAALIHRDFMRWSRIYPDSPLALSHKLIAIQKLKEVISSGEEVSRDEVILAILILACQDIVNVTRKKELFNSPLQKGSWLNVYGNIQQIPAHLKAVMTLVALRGGLENLELKGLAQIITGGDLISAVNSLSKPILPSLRIHENCIPTVRMWANSPLRMPSRKLASSFRALSDYGITDAMLEVLDSMGHLTMAIDYFIQGIPGSLTLGVIIKTRAAIQKHVMVLPTAEELNIVTSSRPSIYECCRLTAIIFSIAVIFPIPNTYDVLQTLVRHLKAAIESSGIESGSAECSGVSLWILVLGGIAALDKPEKPWFVSQLAFLAERLDIDWAGTQHILETFLWLESACGASGLRLWSEVVNLML